MKKLCLLLALMWCLITGTAMASGGPRFDGMRTVLICDTTQTNYAAQYMKKQLREPFRLPYWDRIDGTTPLSPGDVSMDTLSTLSNQYNADIVLVPVVRTWYWREYSNYYWYDDDETITECIYNLTVYAYNRKTNTLESYTSRGSEREETSILNNPDDVLYPAMNQIMRKLPYKRIPTDLEEPADVSASSVLQTRTTDGGAKIITNTSPMAI